MTAGSRAAEDVKTATGEVDWEAVYAEQLPRVFNFFRYRVSDGLLAEDLTAATLGKAWAARGRYRRDRAAFSTWLFTIARRVAIDHYRRRRPEVPLDEARSEAAPDSVEDAAQRRSNFARLRGLLNALPEREQELVALKYGAALNNREIGAVTGLTESNVGTILHRTVEKLRAEWESER